MAGSTLAIGIGPAKDISVALPKMDAGFDQEMVVPVNVHNVANTGVISYEFDLRYDPSVIQPVRQAVDVKGTASHGLTSVVNSTQPGLLRVVVYGATAIDADGVLLNLRFMAVGKPGTVSPLTFEGIIFNEGERKVNTTDGQVELSDGKGS